jgi:hypothetical protein
MAAATSNSPNIYGGTELNATQCSFAVNISINPGESGWYNFFRCLSDGQTEGCENGSIRIDGEATLSKFGWTIPYGTWGMWLTFFTGTYNND